MLKPVAASRIMGHYETILVGARPIMLLADRPPFDGGTFHALGVIGLHFGSGASFFPGWLNVDRMTVRDDAGRSSETDRVVRVGADAFYLEHADAGCLPIVDESLDRVYSEHVIEHLSPEEGIAWLREVRRMLRVGGLLRLSTPDLKRYVDGYGDPSDEFYSRHRRHLAEMNIRDVPERRAWMINQIFRFWGHRWIYDFEELRFATVAAGFSPADVVKRTFRAGGDPEMCRLDHPIRSDESLYAEVRKTQR